MPTRLQEQFHAVGCISSSYDVNYLPVLEPTSRFATASIPISKLDASRAAVLGPQAQRGSNSLAQ